jgi:small-conductance mechanosensitive channel
LEEWTQIIEQLPGFNYSNSLTDQALKTAIALIVGLLIWFIIKMLTKTAKKRLVYFELIQINGKLFDIVRKFLGYGLILIVGLYIISLFHLPILDKLFPAAFIIILAGPLKDVLLVILNFMEKKWVDQTETKVDDIIFDLLNKFSGTIIYAVAIVLALDILGINVMPFVAGAGVLGVAIGFAAKDTLSNLIAGILLIIDRPFEMGDRIEVWSAPKGSATWGDVIDIGLRATKIKTTDNIIIVIPNNEIMTRDIVNYTLISSDIRVRINIGVAYDADIEHVKQVILNVADGIDWILKAPAPKVVVVNFGESSVDLQLRVWIENARKRMDTISHVTDRVKAAFDAEKIEIPYPKRDIHIIQ